MKAKRTRKAEDVNPLYDAMKAKSARRSGTAYNEPQFLEFPVGQIVDDPQSWRLCIGADPEMVPFDDECRKKVETFKASPRRQKFLRGLLKFYNNHELILQLSKDSQEVIKARLDAYENELLQMSGVTDPDEET